jgi:PAS domain S-box-containing protein
VTKATGVFAMVMGAAALCGWLLEINLLASFAPGLAGMRPDSAVVFLLLGLSLIFHGTRVLGVLGPVAVATIAVLTLIESTGLNLGVSGLVGGGALPGGGATHGPIPTATDLGFLLLASAMLLVRRGGVAVRAAQPFALAAGGLAWLAITGYANGVSLYRFPVSAPITLNSAIALIAVVVGVLALRPNVGVARLVTSRMAGGWILRVVGPITIVAPTLFAWMRRIGESSGLYGNQVGNLLLVFALALVLLGAMAIAAGFVERSDGARAKAEAGRLANEAVLDQFFTLSLELLCIADEEYLRRVNPTWEATLGWSAGELTTTPFLELVHPGDVDGTTAVVAQLAEGQAVVGFENRYRCSDASYRWIQWSATTGSEGLIYFTGRDVTERKHGEETLRQRTAELSAANEELEAFAYSVSHDLRAPLRGIDGFSQAVLEEYSDSLDEVGQSYLVRLRAASQRMGTLIDDMLSLSRVSRVELNRTSVDMSAMATTVAAELQDREPGRQVEFAVGDHVTADGDGRFLRIVLENLFANAFKFTATRTTARIEFGHERVDGEDVFFVRDDGVGFDMAYADQLFVPFHRLHSESDFPGSGIGLATISRIARRHGGRSWAYGEVDRGATVYFTLGGSVDHQ